MTLFFETITVKRAGEAKGAGEAGVVEVEVGEDFVIYINYIIFCLSIFIFC